MIRDKPVDIPITKHTKSFVPSMTLRKSTVNQFRALGGADSITIDPHKAGYIPYVESFPRFEQDLPTRAIDTPLEAFAIVMGG